MLVCKVHNTVLNGLRVKFVFTNKQRQDLNQKYFRDLLIMHPVHTSCNASFLPSLIQSQTRLALKMLDNPAEI